MESKYNLKNCFKVAVKTALIIILTSCIYASAVTNEENAYLHLYEVMDKYHTFFDIYTDKDAAGNHYVPSGWMGDLEDITFEGNSTNNPHSGTTTIKITYSADFYQDNHYVPSGWMGDTAYIKFNDSYTTNPHSGSTSIKITYSVGHEGWAGIYWQDPEGNWGQIKEGGYNLTGATNLTFWARGENGGEKIEFKVGGITGNYPDSLQPAVSSGVITLTNEWKQYSIDLTGKDLSHIIGGFAWVTNKSNNPNGATFYLDDIKYDQARLDELRYLVSYEATSAPDDIFLKNVAFTYDNALVMLAFMARGTEEDWKRAKILGDSFIYSQNHDRSFKDGRLRNAYQGGDIADLNGSARLPGWWDDKEKKWFEDRYYDSSYTGNLAWVMLSLLRYYEVKNESQYLEASEKLGNWIYNNTYDTRGAGGYTGGYDGYDGNQTKLQWKSTEHNLDVYVAFMKLYEATNNSLWKNRAMHAKNFVKAMWNEKEGNFWTGTLDDGITLNKNVLPADVNTWGLMALGELEKYGAGINWVENNCIVNDSKGDGFKGFDFNDDQDGVWFEGTAHTVIAFQIKNETNKSMQYLMELRKAQTSANNSNGKGIVAASHDGVSTGFDWVYNNRLHIGATAWYIFAERNHNPYWQINTSDQIPYDGIYEACNVTGDLNYDCVVDFEDVILVVYMVLGIIPEDPKADFNNNNRVDIGDAVKLAYYVVGKISSL